MKTRAKVIRTEGKIAWVRVCHGEYCSGCGLHSPEDKMVDLAVRNAAAAKPGDKVEVVSDTGLMLRTVFLVFWLPLAIAALFAWAGYGIALKVAATGVVGAVALGFVGLAVGIFVIYRAGKKTETGAGLTISRVFIDEYDSCRGQDALQEGGH